MKIFVINRTHQLLLIAAISSSILLLGGIQPALAYDNHGDQNGGRDSHGRYHHYSYYHHHRGYWNEDNGARIWINIEVPA